MASQLAKLACLEPTPPPRGGPRVFHVPQAAFPITMVTVPPALCVMFGSMHPAMGVRCVLTVNVVPILPVKKQACVWCVGLVAMPRLSVPRNAPFVSLGAFKMPRVARLARIVPKATMHGVPILPLARLASPGLCQSSLAPPVVLHVSKANTPTSLANRHALLATVAPTLRQILRKGQISGRSRAACVPGLSTGLLHQLD